MQRITVAEAERDFSSLVNRVYSERISIELQRGDEVVARLTPAAPQSPLKVRDLNTFLAKLPKLNDDAEAFSNDVRAIRHAFPSETSSWD
jgi:antitoxin (DNA-binding transcriptional repressor) of toxin-antitoxin stability system